MEKEYPVLKLKDIIPYENNPRINDQAAKDVGASIDQCGYIANIIVDENNVILAGHTRYKALKKRKIKEIEVERVTGLTEEQKTKYRILDNKTGESALWDLEKLECELAGIDFQGYDFQFDMPERFSIDDINEVDGYDADNDNQEYFTSGFTFPYKYKKQIVSYLNKHKSEITEDIIRKAIGE